MFHNVLVAIDDSSTARRALGHAIDLCDALHARLTILTVAPEVPAFARGAAAGVDVVALEEAAEAEADRRLRAALELVPESVSVTTILRQGHAAKAILAVAAEHRHDLIVMGSRRRGRLVSNVLGSTAASVHYETTLPMLVVHPQDGA
jgi:nucleotide-binding universal stress UspA family protein